MPDRQIHGTRRVFSASTVRDTIADTLSSIRDEDKLTYADIGRVMGRSADRAEAWCGGDFSDLGSFALLLAWREWNGRFIGPLRDLVENSRPGKSDDRATLSVILECAARLSKALENGEIDIEEVRDSRSQLEAARDVITDQLAKLGPTSESEAA